MVENIENDIACLLDSQMHFHEKVEINLCRALALMQVALGEDFLNYDKAVITDYLAALGDLLDEARDTSRRSQEELLQKGIKIVN